MSAMYLKVRSVIFNFRGGGNFRQFWAIAGFFGCGSFCLQLEASCLQLSFFADSCVWEFFCLMFELF